MREDSATSPPREPTHPLVNGLTATELAQMIRQRFYDDRQYARQRRRVWAFRATFTRVSVLFVSAVGTVLLGLAALDGLAALGFVCSALVTVGAAVEPFFNWRARWVLAEEALADWHAQEEQLCLYVASTREDELQAQKLLAFDVERRGTWTRFNRAWLGQRRAQVDVV